MKSETKVKRLERLFRGGSVMFAIARRATRSAISRTALIRSVAKATGASIKTIQSEISYLLNPEDPRNGHRVRMDSRVGNRRVRLVAA